MNIPIKRTNLVGVLIFLFQYLCVNANMTLGRKAF